PAIANHHARMQSHSAEPASGQMPAPGHAPDDPYVDSGLAAVFKGAQDLLVGQVRVVDQQFTLGAFDEGEQTQPRIRRAYNQFIGAGLIGLAFGVTLKEPRCFPHQLAVSGHNAEAAGSIAADRKSTRLNSSHLVISYAVFCLKTKKIIEDSHCRSL